MKITTIGIDLAKEVFQIRGVDEHGKEILRKRMGQKTITKFFANTRRSKQKRSSLDKGCKQ